MASLTASGIGSGLDVNSIVSQLMTLERRPLDQLNAQGTKLNAQLSAYGQLKSSLSTFQTSMQGLSTASQFNIYSATPSDPTIFTATADQTAAVGAHTIDVLSLAKAHMMTSGVAGGAPTYANATTSIGTTGTLELTQNIAGTPRTFQVAITAANNTLSGIRDAINNASTNTGVIASVVNSGTQSQLVLTAKDTGTANAITVGAGTTASVSTALGFGTLTGNAAADASAKIDGITITSSSNTISTALQGVTLNLNKIGSGQTLNVARDTTSVQASVQKFIDSYNNMRHVIKTMGSGAGTLAGESVLNNIDRRLQSIYNTNAVGLSYKHLSEIGIKTDPKTGDLSLNTTTFNKALSANYSGVADLFSNATQGFAVRLSAAASNMTLTNGIIDSRTSGINSNISNVNKRVASMESQLTLKETQYRSQFTKLDGLISQLQSTGNYMTQQLAGLAKLR